MTDDRRRWGASLTDLARRAVESYVRGVPMPPLPDDPALAAPAGAFVTVYVGGDLRGCIGRTDASDALGVVIAQCAVAAAADDPRFAPVHAGELGVLQVQVSLLSPLRPLLDPAALEVGRHGLVVEQGRHRGLLLPQVAVEHGWSAGEFLQHTCTKAGLPGDCWRSGASLFVFEAEVFGGA